MADKRKVYYIVGSSEFACDKFNPEKGDTVIAADGGYAYVGDRADYVVGDWDSLGSKPEGVACISLPTHKDLTDTGYAISLALESGATEIRLLGMDGGRIDHYLANLQYAVHIAERGVKCALYCKDSVIYALAAGKTVVEGKIGSLMSFIPMKEGTVVSLKGVEYPLDYHLMPADNPGLGVSNVLKGGKAYITVHEGAGLIVKYD
ncbi:MAG: thiamine diphosphokinase [Clostridia bacterium]|nr:thiamine diphosphokinase [Clostridia bacterium]